LKTKLYNKIKAASGSEGSKINKAMAGFLGKEFEGYDIAASLSEKKLPDEIIGDLQTFAMLTEFFNHQLAFGNATAKKPTKFWQAEQPFAGVYLSAAGMQSFVVPTVSSLAKGTTSDNVGEVVSKGENVFLLGAYTDVFMATAIANRPKNFFDAKTFKTITGQGRLNYVIPAPAGHKADAISKISDIDDSEMFKKLYGSVKDSPEDAMSAKDRVSFLALAFSSALEHKEDEDGEATSAKKRR